MAQDRPHRSVTDADNDSAYPSREDRIATARAVVYDEAGDLIDPEEINDALEAYGVTVSEDEEGTTKFQDVPRNLSLSVCHLAVDLRQDPAEIIADSDEH